MDELFSLLLTPQKSVEEFGAIENIGSYENVGIIDKNLTDEKLFVCFFIERKQKFFLARSHQLPIIKKICESSDKEIPYEELTGYGLVQAKGFKYILPKSIGSPPDRSSERSKRSPGEDSSESIDQSGGIPVIGYINNRSQRIYAIPMVFYGSSGNGMISRFEKGEEGEYFLYDKEEKLIDSWPLSE